METSAEPFLCLQLNTPGEGLGSLTRGPAPSAIGHGPRQSHPPVSPPRLAALGRNLPLEGRDLPVVRVSLCVDSSL